MKTSPTTISFQSNQITTDLVFSVAPLTNRAHSPFKLFSPKWCGCLIALFTIIFVSKSFGQDCSAGVDITLTCVDGITPSTSALLATPIGGTWSNATDNPTVATFTPNAAATVAGNLEAGVYRFIYTTTVPTACSDTVQVTIPDCQSLCLPVEVSDTLVCVGTVVDLTALVPGFNTLLSSAFTIGGVDGIVVADPLAFVADSTTTLTLVASNLTGCSDTTQLTVNVSPLLDLSASVSDTLVCAGTVLDLTALVSGFDTLLNAAFTIGDADGVTIVDATAFVADSTTTLTLVASNLTGCSDTTQLTVNVSPLLDLSASVSDTLVCAGTVLDLTGLVAGFDTLLNVSFEVDGLPVTNASAFAVDSAVTIQVTASTALGCSNTKPLVVTVSDCGNTIDLSLNKSISRKLAMLGDTLTYTILVMNEGSDLATGITVTDSLNAGVQYLSSATAMGSYDPNTKIWTVDSLNAGDTVSLNITVRVVAQGVWFNTAEISGANQNDIDSTPGNGAEGEDDIDRQCFTVPYLICQGQGTVLELNVPGQYTGVVWFRQMQGGQQEQVGTGNTYEVSETELGSYEYTFTSTSGSCPAEGCCPVIVVVEDCCPANLCVPFVITKKVK